MQHKVEVCIAIWFSAQHFGKFHSHIAWLQKTQWLSSFAWKVIVFTLKVYLFTGDGWEFFKCENILKWKFSFDNWSIDMLGETVKISSRQSFIQLFLHTIPFGENLLVELKSLYALGC